MVRWGRWDFWVKKAARDGSINLALLIQVRTFLKSNVGCDKERDSVAQESPRPDASATGHTV